MGLTDNVGAIHSAERILEILGQRLNYPGLDHIKNLRNYDRAKFSRAALEAHLQGEAVDVEHVSPKRALTRAAIDQLDKGATDDELLDYIRRNYELVLLTKAERSHLDKLNRSNMTRTRLADAGIEVRFAKDWNRRED